MRKSNTVFLCANTPVSDYNLSEKRKVSIHNRSGDFVDAIVMLKTVDVPITIPVNYWFRITRN